MSGADLRLALELADVADAITLRRFGAADLVVDTKPDMTPVSEADRAVEQALRARLAAAAPGDAVLGEEFGGGEGGTAGGGEGGAAGGGEGGAAGGGEGGAAGGRRWIVDPIDGTKGYVRGIPVWATLLALEQDGEIVAGVVSAPALGRRWWAARGEGAFGVDLRDGGEPRRLHVSAIAELADAQICHGGLEWWIRAGKLPGLLELARRCWRARGYGDFWSYMLVAEGAAEVGADPEAAYWDLAAMQIIVEEAGGRFTDLAGVATAAGGDGLATNGLLHDAALALLRR